MTTPQLSLIIAVYNNSRALRFIFAALERQTFKDFEVIIADDGSGQSIAETVNHAKQTSSLLIKHLWQADKGWRKNRILNFAIQESSSNHLVFIDGDCIPGKDFLLDHHTHMEPKKVLLGRRVEHGKRWSDELTIDSITSGAYEQYSLLDLLDGIRGISVRLEHGIRITHPFLRKLTQAGSGVLGCNFSMNKEDVVAVNGFDESYRGPGVGEDTDILYRLGLIGVTGKPMRNLAIQYHLWHPFTDVAEENRIRFDDVKKRNDPYCINGLRNG